MNFGWADMQLYYVDLSNEVLECNCIFVIQAMNILLNISNLTCKVDYFDFHKMRKSFINVYSTSVYNLQKVLCICSYSYQTNKN